MNELIPISRSELNGTEVNAVDARELHVFLESKQDFSDWIKGRIKQYGFVQGVDFTSFHKIMERETGSTTRIEYMISIDMAKELSMVERNDKGKQARQYFIECERIVQNHQFNTPQTYVEALRQLANEVEQRELAIAQRNEAIRTKAYISDKKTATAMATASVAVRKVNQLEDELGRGTKYKAVKSIKWAQKILTPSRGMWSALGKKLTKISEEFGLDVLKVESDQYGTVNAYHVSVIEALRLRLDADENMLGKYRAE